MIINNRKDLDAAPADERTRFMAQLSGTIHKWRWSDTEWEQYADTGTIERFGFTLADFPDAPVPDMPEQSPEEKEAEREREEMDAISVSRFQAKAALDAAGLLDQVETYMQGDDVPRLVKLAWAEASFRRGSKMTKDIGAQMGLTEQQIDDLFIAAEDIEA